MSNVSTTKVPSWAEEAVLPSFVEKAVHKAIILGLLKAVGAPGYAVIRGSHALHQAVHRLTPVERHEVHRRYMAIVPFLSQEGLVIRLPS